MIVHGGKFTVMVDGNEVSNKEITSDIIIERIASEDPKSLACSVKMKITHFNAKPLIRFFNGLHRKSVSRRRIQRELKLYRAWVKSGRRLGTYRRRVLEYKYYNLVGHFNPKYQLDFPF